uniref:Uncharacterized protein n=1 Tax=Anguilla anguilla TaxID=7936 RepID=A0A0E9PXB4_ANGAN
MIVLRPVKVKLRFIKNIIILTGYFRFRTHYSVLLIFALHHTDRTSFCFQ